jgi:hypothetical protein
MNSNWNECFHLGLYNLNNREMVKGIPYVYTATISHFFNLSKLNIKVGAGAGAALT